MLLRIIFGLFSILLISNSGIHTLPFFSDSIGEYSSTEIEENNQYKQVAYQGSFVFYPNKDYQLLHESADNLDMSSKQTSIARDILPTPTPSINELIDYANNHPMPTMPTFTNLPLPRDYLPKELPEWKNDSYRQSKSIKCENITWRDIAYIMIIPVAIMISIFLFVRLKDRISEAISDAKSAKRERFLLHAEQEREREERERIQRREREEREQRVLSSPIRNLSPLQFEEYTALYLKNKGYTSVNLTPQSGDFGADILATDSKGNRVCVQCKKYSQPAGISAIQEIISAKYYYHCDVAIVAVTSNGYTHQAIELAKRAGVVLYKFDDVKHEFILVV